jgi:hypothetical protein
MYIVFFTSAIKSLIFKLTFVVMTDVLIERRAMSVDVVKAFRSTLSQFKNLLGSRHTTLTLQPSIRDNGNDGKNNNKNEFMNDLDS